MRKEGLQYHECKGPIQFNNYVDADFAGLFNIEDSQDPSSAKSRSRCVFTLGGNPIHWVSKLQTTIALSTLEAKYNALSVSLREFLPMRKTVEDICKAFDVNIGETGKMKSTVFEDNNGCLKVAQARHLTPRTKHINVTCHWFWEHMKEGSGIELMEVDTKDQIADICTKALPKDIFQMVRKLLMGW